MNLLEYILLLGNSYLILQKPAWIFKEITY